MQSHDLCVQGEHIGGDNVANIIQSAILALTHFFSLFLHIGMNCLGLRTVVKVIPLLPILEFHWRTLREH